MGGAGGGQPMGGAGELVGGAGELVGGAGELVRRTGSGKDKLRSSIVGPVRGGGH
jgi:X-X-X-Leu-X-X-Gly heptad repeat protein